MKQKHSKQLIYNILIIFCCIFIIHCSPSEEKLPKVIDLEAYWKNNIETLNEEVKVVRKRLKGVDQTQNIIDTVQNWEEELSFFTNIHWNPKVALNYKIDTAIKGHNHRVRYLAVDSTQEIRAIYIEKLASLPDITARVRIERLVKKDIYQIKQTLYFDPLTGYNVQGSQKIPYLYDQYYQVAAMWD